MTAPPPRPSKQREEDVEELPLSTLVEETAAGRAALEDTAIRREEAPLEFEVEGGFTGEDLASIKESLLKIQRQLDELIKKLP